MFAKLKHVAIVSDRFNLLGKFYESLFGMRSSKPSSDEPRGAAVVGDGYVGLNINSRAPGRQSGLDHFGQQQGVRHNTLINLRHTIFKFRSPLTAILQDHVSNLYIP